MNTLYFWEEPAQIFRKMINGLAPGGTLVLAFEDIDQLRKRSLDDAVFRLYRTDEVLTLFEDCGAPCTVRIESRRKGNLLFHCAVATR